MTQQLPKIKQTSKNNNKSTKSVSFARLGLFYEILARSDLTETEVKMTWYDAAEIQEIRFDIKKTLLLHRKLEKEQQKQQQNNIGHPALLSNDEYCMRGLEVFTRDGAMRRKQNRNLSRAAVLYEQALQVEEGSTDSDFLCEVYVGSTGPARQHARNLGIQDTLCVMEFDNNKVPRSLSCSAHHVSNSTGMVDDQGLRRLASKAA